MGNIRIFFLEIAVLFLFFFFSVHAWAADKVAVVQYELKPVESVNSGRQIKTQWNARLRNKTSGPVSFSITIVFVDSNNETLKEATSQCELEAYETKSFKDTVLVKTSIANKIASTRLKIGEVTKTDADTP